MYLIFPHMVNAYFAFLNRFVFPLASSLAACRRSSEYGAVRRTANRLRSISKVRPPCSSSSVCLHRLGYDTFILRLQSIVGSPRGYAASAEASAGFAPCSVDTNRKNRRGQQFICRHFLRIIFCPHPSQTLRIFSMGTRDARG